LTNWENLYRGLSHAAWGYFFVTFDFKLNSVSVLPQFVGFLLLLSAINKLSGVRRDLALLRPLCVLLAVWNFGDWFLSWGGGDLDGRFLFLDLLVGAAGLYFHFQFLTDMAALAERFKPEGSDLDQRLLRRRTAYTLISTVGALGGELAGLYPWEGWAWVMFPLAAVGCVVALMIMTDLFHLRGCLREGAGPG